MATYEFNRSDRVRLGGTAVQHPRCLDGVIVAGCSTDDPDAVVDVVWRGYAPAISTPLVRNLELLRAASEDPWYQQSDQAFRDKVREVAIRVAREQTWCDDGLNAVLEELGLPPKVEPPKESLVTIQLRVTNLQAGQRDTVRNWLARGLPQILEDGLPDAAVVVQRLDVGRPVVNASGEEGF